MGNSFGQLYRISTFGESHGDSVGVVIDGCPSGFHICLDKIQLFLDRRKPGQSSFTSPRNETDKVSCLSGLSRGITLGTPITLSVKNKDIDYDDYKGIRKIYRPSHADYTTELKFGIRAETGGGRASARETLGRVAGAAVARQIAAQLWPKLSIIACVKSIKDIHARIEDPSSLTQAMIDSHPIRCPDMEALPLMEERIARAKTRGDSVGGCIMCYCFHPPTGLGEPVFDKLEADLAKGMMSLPATKGFEIGSGFKATDMFGSEHNDPFVTKDGRVRTQSNNSGGVQGGISNGETILMRVAFKPTSTIYKKQQSIDKNLKQVGFCPEKGRHDPCVLPRAVPMVEAMAWLVLVDHGLRQKLRQSCQHGRRIKSETM